MRENTLDTTRTLPQLLRFVAPSIVMMLAMGIYTITDTLFVSRLGGSAGKGAQKCGLALCLYDRSWLCACYWRSAVYG